MREDWGLLLEADERERLQVEYRQSVAVEWLAAVGKVAEASGVELAQETVDYLYRRAGLGIVLEEDSLKRFYRVEEGLTVDDCFFITPVLTADDSCVARTRTSSGDFINEYGGVARAVFNHSNRSLCFNDNLDAGEIGKGVIFLHESVHIITELKGLVNRPFYPDQLWLEEAEAYQFEYRVLAGLGGPAYLSLVQRIKAGIQEESDGLICAYQFSEADFKILGQIFGEQTSEDELKGWEYTITHNGWLEYFKQHKERPIAQFADFLAWSLRPRDE